MRRGHDGTLWNHSQINVSFSMLLSVTVLHYTNRVSIMRDRVSSEVEPYPPTPSSLSYLGSACHTDCHLRFTEKEEAEQGGHMGKKKEGNCWDSAPPILGPR